MAILIANELVEEHPLLRVEATFMATLGDDVEVWVGLRPAAFTVERDSEHLAYGKLHQPACLWDSLSASARKGLSRQMA